MARRAATKPETFPDVVGFARPRGNACSRLLRRVIEQPAHLLGIQTHGTAGGGCRAEGSHQNMRVFKDGPRANGLKGAHPNVVAERYGSREVLSADADFFSNRQRGGHDSAA